MCSMQWAMLMYAAILNTCFHLNFASILALIDLVCLIGQVPHVCMCYIKLTMLLCFVAWHFTWINNYVPKSIPGTNKSALQANSKTHEVPFSTNKRRRWIIANLYLIALSSTYNLFQLCLHGNDFPLCVSEWSFKWLGSLKKHQKISYINSLFPIVQTRHYLMLCDN